MDKPNTVKGGLEDGENGNEEASWECSLQKMVEIKGHQGRSEDKRKWVLG